MLNIREIREKKEDAEKKIATILAELEEETNIKIVDELKITRIKGYGENAEVISYASLKMYV